MSSMQNIDSSAMAMNTVRVLAFIEASWLTGPAKNLIEFARRAAQNEGSLLRAKIAIATFVRGSEPVSNEFTVACRQAGLDIHIIRERFLFDPAVIPAIKELVRSQNPDIVQTHNVKSHFLVRVTGVHRHHPWVAFHHGYTWPSLRVRIYNQLDRWSLRAASKVVTVCHPFARSLERIGVRPERIAIRHNSVKPFLPVTEQRVLEIRRTLGIPPATRVILSVGRLSREKGQADLIEAVSILRKENSSRNLCLVLVGDGPDKQKLQNSAAAAGIADCVLFAGHQIDVIPYYTMADLLVLPSHTEGSPNTLLEAMAAALPIIATAVGGVPEMVIDHRDGLLVNERSPAKLAEAVSLVLGSETFRRRLSDSARTAASAYSPSAYCDFMLSLYRDSLADRATASSSWSRRLSSVRSGGL
jgi:glycosyltransferase involved in cell wall biosynthesis